MSVDYKAMSREAAVESIDKIPAWTFWREAWHLFAKNVAKVLALAGVDDEEIVMAFVRSLPLNPGDFSSVTWKDSICHLCLQKAYLNVPDGEREVFTTSVLDYFLYYFVDRDRVAKNMLIDSFIGVMTGFMEATVAINKGENHEPAPG